MPQDKLRPTLLLVPPEGSITEEQWFYISEVLNLCCSDSLFAAKALEAIKYIVSLTPASVISPYIIALVPPLKPGNSPLFTIRILGQNFNGSTQVQINDAPIATTFVNSNEVTVAINTLGTTGPVTREVHVLNGDGLESNSVNFLITA